MIFLVTRLYPNLGIQDPGVFTLGTFTRFFHFFFTENESTMPAPGWLNQQTAFLVNEGSTKMLQILFYFFGSTFKLPGQLP